MVDIPNISDVLYGVIREGSIVREIFSANFSPQALGTFQGKNCIFFFINLVSLQGYVCLPKDTFRWSE